MAVSAFSPPESSWTLCSRLPGGCGDDLDAALERIVLVEQRQAGAAAAEQRAERLLEVAVDGGERLGEALPRGLVDALDRLAGLRDRVDEVLALRGQEGVARLELVELLDGHHVDRARADRSSRAARRSPLRRSASAGAPRRRSPQPVVARADRPARLSSTASSSASSAQMTLASGARVPACFQRVDFGQDLVERRLHGLEARLGEVREIAFGRRPRQVELGDVGADRFELRARVLNHDSRARRPRSRRAPTASSSAAQLLAQGFQRANLVVELPTCRRRRRSRRSRRALGRGRELGGHDRGPRIELRRGFLEPLHFDGERRGALHQRGMRGARVGGPPVQIRAASRASNRRRCASVSRSSAAR